MSKLDWSRFKRSVFIQADPDMVFDAWIISEQITTWFLEKAIFINNEGEERALSERTIAGDNYAWNWWNYPHTEHGQIYTVDREQRHLEFQFGGDCRVIVDVEVRDGDTLLRLEQKNIPLDEESKKNLYIGCGQGWSFWMLNLKSWLEHGIVLHDQQTHHHSENFEFCELINR